MPVVDEAGAGIGMGSIESAEGGGHHFGVASNAEQTWLVAGVEVSPAVNMMVLCQCKVWEMEGDLGDGGPLDGMMEGVDGIVGVDGMVGTRVASESAP